MIHYRWRHRAFVPLVESKLTPKPGTLRLPKVTFSRNFIHLTTRFFPTFLGGGLGTLSGIPLGEGGDGRMSLETANKEITKLLVDYGKGDEAAMKELFPLVYRELRRLAQSYLRKEQPGTLQPTALVHEAYFKLIDQSRVEWKNRSHFFAIAAQMMRRILIDSARARLAEKRGGDATKVSFDEGLHWMPDDPDSLIALDKALEKLAALDERKAKVVELRFFGGLSLEETAEALDSSPATVKRDWNFAKAFLAKELQG